MTLALGGARLITLSCNVRGAAPVQYILNSKGLFIIFST